MDKQEIRNMAKLVIKFENIKDQIPVGWKTLIEVEKPKIEEKSAGGLILSGAAELDADTEAFNSNRGTVKKIGPLAFKQYGEVIGDLELYKVDDYVLFRRYAGEVIIKDGKMYRVVNTDDIIEILIKE